MRAWEANALFKKWMIEGGMIEPFVNYLKSNDIQISDKWWMFETEDRNQTIGFEVHEEA